MTGAMVPTYSRAQLSGWACVDCGGLAEDGVPAGFAGTRPLFACQACRSPVVEDCAGCERPCDPDDLTPDHNGDMSCQDCLSTWAGLAGARNWQRLACAA